MKMTRILCGGVALVLFVMAPVVSFAADEKASAKALKSKEKAAVEEGVQLQMKDVEIRGELERPEVFYIIPRRKARMDLGSMKRDYHNEIMTPLFPEEFEVVHGKGRK